MIVECDDGDFDFFDIVIEWGVWVYCNGNKIKKHTLMNSFYSDGFDYIGL